jgi:hypothetical protein
MTKYLHNTAAIVTIIVGIITAIGFFVSKSNTNTSFIALPEMISLRAAKLPISGSGVDVLIKEGRSSVHYTGGVLSSSGASQVVYIPVGQQLNIIVSGSGADIGVQQSIAQYVNVSSSASGTEVYEF